MVGVEIVLFRAVPNVRASVGPCSDGNHLSNSVMKQAVMAGSGWEAAAVGGSAGEGGSSATSSAVLFRSLGWCLCFISSSEWTVCEMACFLCFPLL